MKLLMRTLAAVTFALIAADAWGADVSLTIDFGPGNVSKVAVPWYPTETALNVLERGSPKPTSGPNYSADWYASFNSYIVTKIGNAANSGNEAWLFCLHEALMPVGASSLIIAPGDEVIFRYLDTSKIDFSKTACPSR